MTLNIQVSASMNCLLPIFLLFFFSLFHPLTLRLIAPNFWTLQLPTACHTMALNPETVVEMEFGILSTSEYVTDPLAEPSGAKLVLISGLCFGLLPPEPQVVSLRFLFPIFFQAWLRRGAPSQSLASECENGSTPQDFMKHFHILLPSLFWPHSLLAFCPVSVPWDNYHGLEPDKHFVFQFLYFIITMDVEQKG